MINSEIYILFRQKQTVVSQLSSSLELKITEKKIIKVGTTNIGQVGFELRYAEDSYSFPIAHKDYYLVQSTQGILENNSYAVSKSKQQTQHDKSLKSYLPYIQIDEDNLRKTNEIGELRGDFNRMWWRRGYCERLALPKEGDRSYFMTRQQQTTNEVKQESHCTTTRLRQLCLPDFVCFGRSLSNAYLLNVRLELNPKIFYRSLFVRGLFRYTVSFLSL